LSPNCAVRLHLTIEADLFFAETARGGGRLVSTAASFDQVLGLIKRPARDVEPIHKLFCYPAKFQATVPQLIIEKFTRPGQCVLDPFGGGGTTSAAARLLGRNSVHFDLNPMACLVTQAKLSAPLKADVAELCEKIRDESPWTDETLLTDDERKLFGRTVSAAANRIWAVLARSSQNKAAPVMGSLLVRFLKLVGRRDAQARRERPASEHVKWVLREFEAFCSQLSSLPQAEHRVFCRSNHQMGLKAASIPLIVTSPPYPGVDIEYGEIQIQRRDLKRCFRSTVGIRVANLFFGGNPAKKELCLGGDGDQDYFVNAENSLREMRRVLAPRGLCFIYCGFKTQEQVGQYEALLEKAGFHIFERGSVNLSKDRIASSRSLHHGKETHLMKRDYLYILG
jgi:DNA modification methylase